MKLKKQEMGKSGMRTAKMRTARAQLSMELVVVLAMLLLLAISFMPLINLNSSFTASQNKKMDTSSYAERLSGAINTVFLAGDGANASLSLPATLSDSTDYSLSIYPEKHIVEIIWQPASPQQHTTQIITSSIGGQLTNLKGEIRLRNENGEVIING